MSETATMSETPPPLPTDAPGLVGPFRRAWALLELEPGAAPAELKRAYRAMTRRHPPDRDPEGFRAVRAAYELLRDPLPEAHARLMATRPLVEPPTLPTPEGPSPRTLVPLAFLRAVAATVDLTPLNLSGAVDGLGSDPDAAAKEGRDE